MKRRGGGDQLTGGTKDVNPQTFVTATVVNAVANNFAQLGVPLPIPRLPTKAGRNLVMEFLDIDFTLSSFTLALGAINEVFIALNTKSNFVRANGAAGITAALQDPSLIAGYRMVISTAGGALKTDNLGTGNIHCCGCLGFHQYISRQKN